MDEDYAGRGHARMKLKHYDEAASDFAAARAAEEKASSGNPHDDDPKIRQDRNAILEAYDVWQAEALVRAGRYRPAIDLLRQTLVEDPDARWAANALAWILATCPDAKFRDGTQALELARKANSPDAEAAAFAELGRWDEAVAAQKKAIAGNTDANELPADQARLALLEQKKPLRDIKSFPSGITFPGDGE